MPAARPVPLARLLVVTATQIALAALGLAGTAEAERTRSPVRADATAVCHPLPSSVPGGEWGANPLPLIAGAAATVCINPLPGSDPGSFEWDIGDDGTYDVTTTVP